LEKEEGKKRKRTFKGSSSATRRLSDKHTTKVGHIALKKQHRLKEIKTPPGKRACGSWDGRRVPDKIRKRRGGDDHQENN